MAVNYTLPNIVDGRVVPAPNSTAATSFTNNPTSTSGTNPFGYIPGPTGNPIGNAGDLNTEAGNDLASKLGGTISPGTMNALKDASAEWGVSSGLGPGSGLGTNGLFSNIAGFSENQEQQGLQDYNQITGPGFQTNLAENNANLSAAPDPTQAANYAKQLYDEYLQQIQRGKSPAGGTGASAPPTPATPVSDSSVGFPNQTPGTSDPNLDAYYASTYGLLPGTGALTTDTPGLNAAAYTPASFSEYSNDFLNLPNPVGI